MPSGESVFLPAIKAKAGLMQRIVFNHASSRVPGPKALLVCVGLLIVLAILFGVYHKLDQGNSMLEQQLASRQALVSPGTKQPAKNLAVSQAASAEITEAQLHIKTPWIALLQTLEKAQQPHVYWMHLAPDVKRKHIRMTVLAPKRQQGWALVERLKLQPGLSDVKLNASEATDVNGLRMTSLQLEAGWKF